MLNSVCRSKIFEELTEEEKKEWFSLKEKAVRHHVDSLYYSVYISDDNMNNSDERILKLLSRLKELKDQKINARDDNIDFFGLDVVLHGSISGVYV